MLQNRPIIMKKIGLLLLLTFTLQSVCAQSNYDASTLTKVGMIAPEFNFEIAPGKTVNISDYRGKIVLLNFFATWCGPCNAEYPYLQKNIWEKYKDNPHFKLFSFGREQGWEVVTPFAKKKKVSFPVLPDTDRKVYAKFATKFIPRNVILDENGKIIYQSVGFSKEEFAKMEQFIAKRLKN